jgi:lysophospholipase L1-like esterase
MANLRRLAPGLIAVLFLGLACSSTNEGVPAQQGGGSQGSGGNSSGGTVATGGSLSSGGSVSTGGAAPTGGSVSTGGAVPKGGTVSTGGSVSTGGVAATGGAVPKGGTVSTGGLVTTGGVAPTGGVVSKGGTVSTGGTSSGTGGGGPGGAEGGSGGTGGGGGMGGTTGKGGSSGSGGAGGVVDGGAGSGGTTGPFPDAGPVDPSKKITVWMVGDSTMQNCQGTGQCGWAAEFQQYFNANATISNQARGGRSIQTWIWGDPNVSKTAATDANGDCQVIDKTTYSDNLTTMLDPTKGMQPGDWVYVAFGINDASAGCNRHVSSTLFQSDLDFMAKTIRSKGANPIFGTSTSGQSCQGSTNVANRAFGPETKATGAADNVPVVDLLTLSVALYNSLKLCPGGSSTFWFDGTHFRTEGATQVAGVVAQALKDQGIGLAAYLK